MTARLSPISTSRAGLLAHLDKLPGKVAVGNPHGDVTLYQFYDLNCPYCREAAADIDALVHSDAKLKLIFVPYAVLSVHSVRGAMVEVAAAKQLSPAQYLDFHKRIYASRGTIDGARGARRRQRHGPRCARSWRLPPTPKRRSTSCARTPTFGGEAGLAATPAYVIDGVAIVGHPGLKPLQTVIAAVRGCGKVVCSMAARDLADRRASAGCRRRKTIAKGFFDYQRFRVTLADGVHTREVVRAGRVVGGAAVDLARGEIVMIRQFRLAAHLANGNGETRRDCGRPGRARREL